MSNFMILCFYNLVSTFIDPLKREKEYAVITGGNRGIGWYTVKGLVESGMRVIIGKN